jgi:GNAT superfamily N-acetyltransferase
VKLVAVGDALTRTSAEALIREYLDFIRETALQEYRLEFDIEAMIDSDMHDEKKFFPPAGRFYVAGEPGSFVGVGCLKRLAPGVAEIQRMYVKSSARGLGVGRLIVNQLLSDARAMEFSIVRLESLRALSAAHTLYHSVGFHDIEPYGDNSMKDYQSPEAMEAYRKNAVFMEIVL